MARVVSVDAKPVSRWKPLPLTTVELQKMMSMKFRISPAKCLDVCHVLVVMTTRYVRNCISRHSSATPGLRLTASLRVLICVLRLRSKSWTQIGVLMLTSGFYFLILLFN